MSIEEIENKILEILKNKNIISKRDLFSYFENKDDVKKALENLISKGIIFEINVLGGNYYGLKNNKNR
ncbi:MAG: hypothetical protein QW197_01995 [Candidatus Aenigmatarchaeota archaeon]